MQIFQVHGEREGARVRVHASGELDLATVPCLETCTRDHVQGYVEAVELDLREVGFIDSTGVRLLLTLAAEGQRDGWTLTILPSEAVCHIVRLLGLQRHLLAPQLEAVEPQQSTAAA
jgi:anti-anti-sigma factor